MKLACSHCFVCGSSLTCSKTTTTATQSLRSFATAKNQKQFVYSCTRVLCEYKVYVNVTIGKMKITSFQV